MFKIELEASSHQPNHAEMLRLLYRLAIGQCTICKNFFFLMVEVAGEKLVTYEVLRRAKRINVMNLSEEEHWESFDNPNKVKKENRIERYICLPCSRILKI